MKKPYKLPNRTEAQVMNNFFMINQELSRIEHKKNRDLVEKKVVEFKKFREILIFS